jgi:hypothetical protein
MWGLPKSTSRSGSRGGHHHDTSTPPRLHASKRKAQGRVTRLADVRRPYAERSRSRSRIARRPEGPTSGRDKLALLRLSIRGTNREGVTKSSPLKVPTMGTDLTSLHGTCFFTRDTRSAKDAMSAASSLCVVATMATTHAQARQGESRRAHSVWPFPPMICKSLLPFLRNSSRLATPLVATGRNHHGRVVISAPGSKATGPLAQPLPHSAGRPHSCWTSLVSGPGLACRRSLPPTPCRAVQARLRDTHLNTRARVTGWAHSLWEGWAHRGRWVWRPMRIPRR